MLNRSSKIGHHDLFLILLGMDVVGYAIDCLYYIKIYPCIPNLSRTFIINEH